MLRLCCRFDRSAIFFTAVLFIFFSAGSISAEEAIETAVNVAVNGAGRLPKGDNGRELNLDFETGTLQDWTPAGTAFQGQPDRDGIDPNRPLAGNKKSQHTGEYWIGGYELAGDKPQGTLRSVPFHVDANWCSFLIGGGKHRQTRAELVLVKGDRIIATESERNREEMHPVVLNLEKYKGQNIYIRLVDKHSGGWGHINFDDFRFYDKKPVFKVSTESVTKTLQAPLYPYHDLSGDEAARVMQVPPGFNVQCAAHEPDVRQPIAMSIDDRGRVWIAEAYAYPERRKQGTGTDRILIFEDTNLDGILDKRTVFIEGLNLISGLEVGFGGVYVGAAPYLMFIPDRNRNDIPDGQEAGSKSAPVSTALKFPEDVPIGAEVLLDGWAWQDTHETLNAFCWGPDGWLYGCHGVFTHSNVGQPGASDEQRTKINAGVWRFHPVSHQFEVFIEGTSNPWGIDFNKYGDAFCTACVIPHLYYLIPGGRYHRQAGNHFNPATYRDIQTIARHRHYVGNQWNQNDRRSSDDVGGGHAHAGAMIYQGGAWPEEYTGKLFMHNIHGNRVNVDVLIPEGSGYAGDRNPDFLLTGDRWSQMINMRYGPDGQVWMIDWYDQEQCHRREESLHDRSNGRIYRVSYGDVQPVRVNLQKLSNDELIQHALTAKNEWFARHARRILQERSLSDSSMTLAKANTIIESLELQHSDPVQTLRLIWVLNSLGEFSRLPRSQVDRFLAHPDPHVRSWCIRLLIQNAEDHAISDGLLRQFERLARTDPSPVVRVELASAAGKLPLDDRWIILENLIAHASDAEDHNIPAMIWYAMEPLASVDPQRALALGMSAGESIPLLRELMIRRLGSGKPEEALSLLVKGLQAAKTDESRLTFLKGIRGALVGVRDIQPPKEWEAIYPRLIHSDQASRQFDVYLYALGLGARFGHQEASEDLRRIIVDEAGPVVERRVALDFLVEDRDPHLVDVIQQLLRGFSLRAEALKASATLDQPAIARAIIDSYSIYSPQEQADACNTLASRASYAVPLLKAVESNRIPKRDLSADIIRQLRNLDRTKINSLLEKVWGVVRESNVNARQQIAALTELIEASGTAHADRELGRAIFAKTCQQCHTLFGTGGKVGPDITGSNRANLNYLLSNIVDPSAVMAKEYQPIIVATTDGRVVTGILKEETQHALTLQTTNELVTIPKDEIDARRQSEKSMMPDGILNSLSTPQILSLLSYLSGAGQVPIRATPETLPRFFNGVDLSGWRAGRKEDAGLWSLEGGEIVGRSPGIQHHAFLISELSAKDFRFSCEVKLSHHLGTSGIQFRSQTLADGGMRGMQATIGTGHWGNLYEEQGRGLLASPDQEPVIAPETWVSYEIIAVGSRIQVFLNGRQTIDLNDPQAARSGVFALQLRSGEPTEVRFRKLKLQLLPPLPEYARQGSPPQLWPMSKATNTSTKIRWKKTSLDRNFRSEGCCVADFDNDGDLDIAAGSVWYEHPNKDDSEKWKSHLITAETKEFNPKGYSDSFMNYAEDLNGDGWQDLIVVGFPGKQTLWFTNPGEPGKDVPWKQQLVIPVTNNESATYLDLNGDGQRELISGVENKVLAYSTPTSFPQAPWKMNPISSGSVQSANRFAHGLGAGDLNRDGRMDVITPQGWWEQPASLSGHPWSFHEAALGQPSSQMFVHDFNDDGHPDVLSASAHRFGIWWHEQQRSSDSKGKTTVQWKEHLIDESISQTHAVVLADINGDGQPDFVTGRRHWAHNGKDPGGDQPAFLVWFEYQLDTNGPTWTKHVIDEDSGVGTQFEVADINGDGLLDIVTSNKKGTFLFEQIGEKSIEDH